MILEKCGPSSSIFLNWKFQCVPNARIQIEKIKQDNIPKAGTNTPREIPTEDISKDTSFSKLKLSFGDKTIPIHASLFSESHQDLERDFRLHRFHWLLSSIYQEDSTGAQRQGLQAILFWIAHPHSKNFMDPYSISERVCNWIGFLEWLTEQGRLPEELKARSVISDSIKKQLLNLSQHLEALGPWSNNHLLNNGRALYLGGHDIKDLELSALGKSIVQDTLPKFIKDGHLVEGSSHYQLLYTQRILDLAMCAHANSDLHFYEALHPVAQNMITNGQNLFSNQGSPRIPRLGDISPDCEPSWLEGAPFSHHQKPSPWASILPSHKKESLKYILQPTPSPAFQKHPKNGPHSLCEKIEFGPWTIWVINNANADTRWHGHNDNGALEIWHGDNIIVCDPGRKDYSKSHASKDQISSQGHNLPFFESLEQDRPASGPFFNNKCRPRFSKFKKIEQRDTFYSYQVEACDKSFSWIREIHFSNGHLSIKDLPLRALQNSKRQGTRWITPTSIPPQKEPSNQFKVENITISIEQSDQPLALHKKPFPISMNYGSEKLGSLIEAQGFKNSRSPIITSMKVEAHQPQSFQQALITHL